MVVALAANDLARSRRRTAKVAAVSLLTAVLISCANDGDHSTKAATWKSDRKMLAAIQGTLSTSDGCLSITSRTGISSILVLAEGRYSWDEETAVMKDIDGGREIHIGDRVSFGGGTLTIAQATSSSTQVLIPPSCTNDQRYFFL